MIKERNTFEFPDTFKVECLIESPKQYDVEDLVKIIGNKILGHDKANIIIQYNNKLLDKFSTEDCKLQALLDKSLIPHTYNLLLRTNINNLDTIICHEMKHFDQYEKGDLEIIKDNNMLSFMYKGIKYDSSTDYFNRPWEKEAIKAQSVLWKQFKKLYYK